MKKKQRIQNLLQELNNGVYEKEEVMALSLLSAIAGESIFMLGAPGVAKSLIARRLKYAFKDGKSFEYLMSRFSTPDEIFGPVAISKLKNEDKYERVTENYLPNADVVFLDEIWKAGPSIQNALLTVINEKVYRNGAQEIKVPMKALISTSNELPAKNEGLEALWDRFLVRLIVDSIQKKENFNAMISEKLNSYEDNISENLKITKDDFAEWSEAIDEVEIPENVFNVIDVIRKKIQLHNDKENNKENQIYISDRRWRKIVRLLRTSAFLNDRKAVDLMDCFLIKDCLWNEETQIETVKQIVSDAIGQHGYKLQLDFKSLEEELDDFKKEVDTFTNEIRQIKHTVNKVYTLNNKKYLRILGLQGKFDYDSNDLIEEKDIISASEIYKPIKKEDSFITTRRHRKDFQDSDTVYIKKGQKKNSLILSNNNYSNNNQYELQIEAVDVKKEKVFTKKPHPSIEKDWDKKITQYLEFTNQQRSELEKYKTKDLAHLRVNTFVNSALANVVEAHLTKTQKEIEKYEVEIRKIQNDYKKLKDEEQIIN